MEYFNQLNQETGQYEVVDLGVTPVDTFVGLGCPGAFEGSYLGGQDSILAECLDNFGSQIINNFEEQGKTHFTQKELGKQFVFSAGLSQCGLGALFKLSTLDNQNKISINLANDYLDFIQSSTDQQPGNFEVNEAHIIYGTDSFPQLDKDDDGVVTEEDAIGIVSKIDATIETNKSTDLEHKEIPASDEVFDLIKKAI